MWLDIHRWSGDKFKERTKVLRQNWCEGKGC
jgi:hypothetical protein